MQDNAKHYVRTHAIKDGTPSIEYCHTSRRKRVPGQRQTIDELILMYTAFSLSRVTFHTYTDIQNPSPVRVLATIDTGSIILPAFIEADILPSHLPPPNSQPSFPTAVNTQMTAMGQLDDDERGHLLAHSLGGSTDTSNIVPMAARVNRHMQQTAENRYARYPASFWRSNEDFIRNFLRSNTTTARVHWRLGITYDEDVLLGQTTNFRPVSFCSQFDCYYGDITNYTSTDVCFYNDNEYACKYSEKHKDKRDIKMNGQRCIQMPKLRG